MIMLMVFLLFESFPNALAELTLFADREFYQDWWNATSIEEFYAKWLKFSYLFYYRHVLKKLESKYKLSPNTAKAITNLVSAAMQELIMVRAVSHPLSDHELPSVRLACLQGSACSNPLVSHIAQVQTIRQRKDECYHHPRILDRSSLVTNAVYQRLCRR